VSQLEVFISKLGTIDGLATSTITISEITTLNHKVLDDTMEAGTLITITLFTGSQELKVLSSLGYSLTVQAHDNTAKILITLLDIKVD
jgi:UDP-N-acetylglucosamine enolpyruvyl transferase